MVTKDQFEDGCELWRVMGNKVLFSIYNNTMHSKSASETVLGNEDFFATREEAEDAAMARLLVRLNKET